MEAGPIGHFGHNAQKVVAKGTKRAVDIALILYQWMVGIVVVKAFSRETVA